jgi:hypothetical protein
VLFNRAFVFHSVHSAGRHWLTTLNQPPLQLGPVAANHLRVGSFLLRILTPRLSAADHAPDELVLTRADVTRDVQPRTGYPEIADPPRPVRVRFELHPGPGYPLELLQSAGADEIPADEETQFFTPLPPIDWPGSFDDWIADAGRALGFDAPPPLGPETYHQVFADAIAEVQRRLPGIREQFRNAMPGVILALKIGLPTRAGGTEYVWLIAESWGDDGKITATLDSSPHDCEGYASGQRVTIPASEIVDYMIGGTEAGPFDPGLTQRIAEDYGRVFPAGVSSQQ